MFAQRTSGAFVCLRCQFSLAARHQSRRPAFQALRSATPQCARVSTRARLCQEHVTKAEDGSDEFFLDPLGMVSNETNEHANNAPAAPADVQEETPPKTQKTTKKTKGKPRMSSRPLKIRGRKGAEVRESSAPLTKEVLGAPSEVIILREALSTKVEGPKIITRYATLEPEKRRKLQESIEASIAGNIAVSGQEDVDKSIDKLRPESLEGPNYPVFLLRKEINKIKKEMDKSYTVSQLKRYIKTKEGQRKLDQLSLFGKDFSKRVPSEPQNKRVLFKSKWMEGIHEPKERLPDPAAQQPAARGTSKSKLVGQIIFDIWEVGMIEENEIMGQIEVQLRPWQIELLMGEGHFNTTSHLERIGLARSATFEVYTSIDMIRVTSTRPNAEQAVIDIENVLQTTERRGFSVSSFAALTEARGFKVPLEAFREKEVADAARLTATVIQSVQDDLLLIRGTSKESIEDARRLLMAMIDPWTRAENQVMYESDAQGFLQAQGLENDLPYRYRQKSVARFTLPVSRERKAKKSDSAQNEDTPSINTGPFETDGTNVAYSPNLRKQVIEHLAPAIYTPRPEPDVTPSPDGIRIKHSYWKDTPETELKATLGKVLHHVESPDLLTSYTLSTLASSQNASPDRTFSHAVPSFSALLRQLTLETAEKPHFFRSQKDSHDSLIFRFIPSPWYSERGIRTSQDFPELILGVNLGYHRATMAGMHLVVRERNADALLPTKPTDIRFTARQILHADKPTKVNDIREFVRTVESNIDGTGQIRAPPKLEMRIPVWTVQNAEEYMKYRVYQDDRGVRELNMLYVFAGVEHRQLVRFLTDNERLRATYTGVEGGLTGGRRGEIGVTVKRGLAGKESSRPIAEAQVGELADGALELVDAVGRLMSSRDQFEKWTMKEIGPKKSEPKTLSFGERRRRVGGRETKAGLEEDGRMIDAFGEALGSATGNDDRRKKRKSKGMVESEGEREPDAFDNAFFFTPEMEDGKKRGKSTGEFESQGEREPDAFDDAFFSAPGKEDGKKRSESEGEGERDPDDFNAVASASEHTGSMPARPEPVEVVQTESSVEGEGIGEQSSEEQSLEEQPAKEPSLEGQDFEERTLKEQLAEEQPAEEQPATEQTFEKQPVEEQPVEEQPVEEQTLEQQPATDQPVEEQTLEQQPAPDQPVEEQTLENQPDVLQALEDQGRQEETSSTDDHTATIADEHDVQDSRIESESTGTQETTAQGETSEAKESVDTGSTAAEKQEQEDKREGDGTA